MQHGSLFQELVDVLTQAGVEVRTEPFQHPAERAGGFCRIEGRNLVLLDASASRPQQARALLEAVETLGLSRLGIAGSDLSPALLRNLNRRGRMPWPHRLESPPVANAKRRFPK